MRPIAGKAKDNKETDTAQPLPRQPARRGKQKERHVPEQGLVLGEPAVQDAKG